MFHLITICGLALPFAAAANAQEIDWKKVDDAVGRGAAVASDVHRYNFPRTDLNVTLDGVTIKPALALGGWSKTYFSRLFCGVALERVSRSPRQSTATFSFSSRAILRFTTFTLTYRDRHRSHRQNQSSQFGPSQIGPNGAAGAGRWPLTRRIKGAIKGAARSIRNRLGKPSVAQSLDDLRRLTGSLRFPRSR
jgi:hypothetical protein